MRRLRYSVAMSLDGYIAGPHGEYDWIPSDPTIDFAAMFDEFDAFVMGRRTFETLRSGTALDPTAGRDVIVFSRTLDPAAHPDVTIVAEGARDAIEALKAGPGRDIWLFGGGNLFGSLLDAGVVDTVEVAVAPVLLGGGIPLLPAGHRAHVLRLSASRILPSGLAVLIYEVER
jgi:dihydrofolate reductase